MSQGILTAPSPPRRLTPRRRLVPLAVAAGLLVLAGWATVALDIRPARLSGIANLLELAREALPPDTALTALAFRAILETLQIAFLGTLVGSVLALPLGVLGSRNLFGRAVTVPARVVLAGIRTLPALLWAVVFVVAV
ncbi:MAG TPA: hypothetical protein VGR27_08350, partial [Longimicrobiaceae bacterium]|nr:hypothetical protein [Longimicrobiaceae bacterium]